MLLFAQSIAKTQAYFTVDLLMSEEEGMSIGLSTSVGLPDGNHWK